MCGIFCCISRDAHRQISDQTISLLLRRGPDSLKERNVVVNDCIYLTCVASVLSMRGNAVVPQPLFDECSGSILCWNGEAWKLDGQKVIGNDSHEVFDLLMKAAASSETSSKEIARAFSRIRGPFACVFYDGFSKKLYFGRDCLGRRSLVKILSSNGDLIIASVSESTSGNQWSEVEGDGIYVLSLSDISSRPAEAFLIEHIPSYYFNEPEPDLGGIAVPFPRLNAAVPSESPTRLSLTSSPVDRLHALLTESVTLRIQNRPELASCPIGVLFSGGLDCTMLTYYCHLVLPPDVPIDLLNVAFQNPRIHDNKLEDPFSLCPDRITGITAYNALKRQCPERQFRFVAINIPYTETIAHRDTVIGLMHPHDTEMDLSIASALYFASRGQGVVISDDEKSSYTTPSRVLLSGLGADELFGGYSRHSVAFSRRGYSGLIAELELDFNRLGKRNLGRDDRVTSHWSREVRYPFLDEGLVTWAVNAPVWVKCGFGTQSSDSDDTGIEDGKLILRLLAWRAGLTETAHEKKRAIQFGSRTAKMYTTKTKGTDTLSAVPQLS